MLTPTTRSPVLRSAHGRDYVLTNCRRVSAYQPGKSRWEVAYAFHPTAEAHVVQRSLRSGECNNSSVDVDRQSLVLGDSYRFSCKQGAVAFFQKS
jgi:hypothetical protein